jgi:AraC-like DNA-binding protein
MAEPARIIAFHFVLDGRLLLQVDGTPPVELRAGTMVLLPRNDRHILASEAGLSPVSGDHLAQSDSADGLARIRYGGGGEKTQIVCGFVGTDVRQHPLIDALPPVLTLDLNGTPSCDWVARSFRYASEELGSARPGSAAVLAMLSELLFVEAIRQYVAMLPPDRRGWLSGLRDPVVGRALALLHTQIARAWTAEELAREVFLSRSAFAERFTALIGVPPIKYLATWRMQVAAQRLRETQRSIAQIAMDVGYESEAAFTRAFKREFAASPAAWRKQRVAP